MTWNKYYFKGINIGISFLFKFYSNILLNSYKEQIKENNNIILLLLIVG